jgi:hypothetical protein
MLHEVSERMRSRSAALLLAIDARLDVILKYWLLIGGLVSAARIALAPRIAPFPAFSTFASYMLLVVAPFASTLLALRWFDDGHLQPQPTTRLARFGRWVRVSRLEAVQHPLYGTGGIMVSLIVGMMLNVPLRAAEYLAAMPPIPAEVPPWLAILHFAMTFDVVVFSSLYMVAFVAALRRVPLFPRLLLAIWLGDLAMQLVTAQMLGTVKLPETVAAALGAVLNGNVKKVLISMALWLPYLLLSTRVNVTFRHRIPA